MLLKVPDSLIRSCSNLLLGTEGRKPTSINQKGVNKFKVSTPKKPFISSENIQSELQKSYNREISPVRSIIQRTDPGIIEILIFC